MPNHRAADVLAFWFGEGADYGRRHKRWFEKQPAFDAEVRQRFLDLYQERAAGLTEPLPAFPETEDAHRYALAHRDVIRRFGRFPHRNSILGRDSTAEELEFLKRPGSSF